MKLGGPHLNATVRPRTFAQELATGLSALDCVLNGEKALYASAELTTGRRLYQLLREMHLRTSAELKQALGEEEYRRRIWDPNFAEALAFARDLRSRHSGALVLSPAPYLIEGWSQPEYLSFWETVIRTRIQAVYLSADWEYSNGCVFEFSVACDAGLPTFDADGRPISLEEGKARIEAAARELERDGLDASGLQVALGRVTV
jgi:hypothetical protein